MAIGNFVRKKLGKDANGHWQFCQEKAGKGRQWPLAIQEKAEKGCQWPLTSGHWPMAIGHWPLAIGHWPLANTQWPLAHTLQARLSPRNARILQRVPGMTEALAQFSHCLYGHQISSPFLGLFPCCPAGLGCFKTSLTFPIALSRSD